MKRNNATKNNKFPKFVTNLMFFARFRLKRGSFWGPILRGAGLKSRHTRGLKHAAARCICAAAEHFSLECGPSINSSLRPLRQTLC